MNVGGSKKRSSTDIAGGMNALRDTFVYIHKMADGEKFRRWDTSRRAALT